MSAHLLVVDDLKTYFKTEDGIARAVDGVSFTVDEGKTLGIVGESGCGKSVTALSILRLLAEPPAFNAGGRVVFKGRDLLKLAKSDMQAVRGNDIGMIFQEPMTSLNPVFSVGFQVAEAIATHQPSLNAAQVREKALEMLVHVGIPEAARRYDDFPHQMSGGMRQRIMIAMALSCNPKLLIADEPTTALDVTIQAQILELIRKLQREMGMTVLLITHDLGVIAETVDEVMVMYAGKVAERAKTSDLFATPLHPYTRGLLDSLPTRAGGGRLVGIPGSVPSLMKLPVGCRFADRCPLVQPHCREAQPPLEEKRPGHLAACFEVKA